MGGEAQQIVAGTTIGRGGFGVLLRGGSGLGKSDLALRALTQPIMLPGECTARVFELVSDDQTVLTRVGGQLITSAPAAIRGKLEVRGIGIVAAGSTVELPLALIADLTREAIERMPEETEEALLGLSVDVIRLQAFEASAPVKLGVALARSIERLQSRA